jgi:hypothetical protein
MKTAVSTAELVERNYLSAGSELLRSCVQAPSDPSTGVVNPTASSPFFSPGRLHIYSEMEENSTLELAAQSLVYSIEIMTIGQTTMLPIESQTRKRETTYRLPADGTFCLTDHGISRLIFCRNRYSKSSQVEHRDCGSCCSIDHRNEAN